MRPLFSIILIGSVGLVVLGGLARAQEAAIDDSVPPERARSLLDPIGAAFRQRVRQHTLFPRLRRALDDAPPFLRDTERVLRPRNYYFDRDAADGTRTRAWAQGGALEYRSGWLGDTLAIGGTAYTSQRLVAEPDEDGTRLLGPRQRPINVLGQAWAQLRRDAHVFTAYRQTFDLPYLNLQDSRMIPNTFEGYSLQGHLGRPAATGLDYGGGYLTHMKRRDDDDFVAIARAAGVDGARPGLAFAGARLRLGESLSVGAIDYFLADALNIAYVSIVAFHPIVDGLEMRTQLQFTHQSSLGNERVA